MEEELKNLIKEAVREAIEEMGLNKPVEPTDEYPEVMESEEAAKYIRLSKGYLTSCIDELEVPYKRAGSKYLFKKSELNRWLTEKGKVRDIRAGKRKSKKLKEGAR